MSNFNYSTATLADKCFELGRIEDELFREVCTILGRDPETVTREEWEDAEFQLPCSYVFCDDYDCSIEVVRNKSAEPMTEEQANKILDLGFSVIFETVGSTGIYWSRKGRSSCQPVSVVDPEKEAVNKLRAQLRAMQKQIE